MVLSLLVLYAVALWSGILLRRVISAGRVAWLLADYVCSSHTAQRISNVPSDESKLLDHDDVLGQS